MGREIEPRWRRVTRVETAFSLAAVLLGVSDRGRRPRRRLPLHQGRQA